MFGDLYYWVTPLYALKIDLISRFDARPVLLIPLVLNRGNATDLSMLPSMDPADVALLQAVGEDKTHLILRNDAGALWEHVRNLKDARLDFVLDNGVSEGFHMGYMHY
jgi:hypothetical protein